MFSGRSSVELNLKSTSSILKYFKNINGGEFPKSSFSLFPISFSYFPKSLLRFALTSNLAEESKAEKSLSPAFNFFIISSIESFDPTLK